MPTPAISPPSAQTLNNHIQSLLSKCSTLNHLKQMQCFLFHLGYSQTSLYSFKIVRFAVLVLKDINYARRIFDSLAAPTVFLYTAMITAYSYRVESSDALKLFDLMILRGRPRPNQFIYPHVLKACTDSSDVKLMKTVHSHIVKTGFDGYGVVRTSLLDAYSRFSDLEAARELFDEMCEKNVVSWTALVSGYARVGEMGKAMELFEDIPEKDVPSWNAVIAGCTQNGLFPEAVGLFRRMVLEGLRPNQTTVACVLSACGHLGALHLGKLVHGYVYKNHIGYSSFVTNALVDMYGKCGSMREARWIFMMLSDKSLTCWNSMINCLSLHGHSESALLAFKDMRHDGPKPDEITYVGVLNSCTHRGLVDEGLSYFKSMVRDYKIVPQIEHYGCVIDLLSRAGRFEEAMGIIKDMTIEPDEVVWGSVLNGCRIHGYKELAEFAIQKLLEKEPNSADYGTMLANLYSESGKWEDVGRVRKMLKEFGRKKLPGCSWIEVESNVHQFYSSDKLHADTEKIYETLEVLTALMKNNHMLDSKLADSNNLQSLSLPF